MVDHASGSLAPVIYLPHGGGPLPLLGDEAHTELVAFLRTIARRLPPPEAILVISAHWEEDQPAITSGSRPGLIYDYYGFPDEAYQVQYPAPGAPQIARELADTIRAHGMLADLDDARGFDHGLFVPLKLMYPEARIPCLQLSLIKYLDPAAHIALGRAIAAIRRKNILTIGSGLSYHNLREFFVTADHSRRASEAFDSWLIETCTTPAMSPLEREQRLINWKAAPSARLCHPREEHLLPLHVCYGVASAESPVAEVVFNQELMGKKVTGLLWS
ncbi:MAG: class III extradiol ring-cleavage dioxygenase [bacterium]